MPILGSMMDADKYTLQEAAEIAGFSDYMLAPGGGIKSWENSRCIGIEISENNVRKMAQDVLDQRESVIAK